MGRFFIPGLAGAESVYSYGQPQIALPDAGPIEGSPSKGIHLASASSYCTIKNNFLDDCNIYCEQTDHNTITENYITGNSYGIYLDSSTYHTITNNEVKYNTLDGITLSSSSDNDIKWNDIIQNDNGIYVTGTSSNC